MVNPRAWIRKKWYSISEDSPQGEWDSTAELMMLEFAESGHPIFRATSPLSRGVLKSKGCGKIVDTLLKLFFAQLFCKSAQSSRCSRRNV